MVTDVAWQGGPSELGLQYLQYKLVLVVSERFKLKLQITIDSFDHGAVVRLNFLLLKTFQETVN